MWNVFENCWLLLTLAGIALVAASFVRQEKPEWGYKPLLAPLLLVLLAFGLDYAFTTDYEAVSAIVPVCKRAAVRGDVNKIMAYISPDYADSSHRSKTAFRAAVEKILPRACINRIRTQSHVITIEGNRAESVFSGVVHLNKNSQYTAMGSLVIVELKFDYTKIARKWYIRRIEVIAINYQPMKWGEIC